MIARRTPDGGRGAETGPAYVALSASLARPDEADNTAIAGAVAADFGGSLPSSWYRTPMPPKRQRGREWTRPAGFGVVAGLLCAAPAIFYLRSVHVAPVDPAALTETLVAPGTGDVSLSPFLAPSDRMRALLELSRLRLASGDVLGARALLSRADAARDQDALFLLAETYDPIRVAEWDARTDLGDRGIARALYTAAEALGHEGAELRLERLGAAPLVTLRANGQVEIERSGTPAK